MEENKNILDIIQNKIKNNEGITSEELTSLKECCDSSFDGSWWVIILLLFIFGTKNNKKEEDINV